ncbi:actin-domain-containing protein [Plenodomus tracheiphilus IPT5]|uniref:Actin-like protein ARP6 n=1 Tax=Plenodomus tracheiphilus IPT5 TaxID=1408161 RepID=A0A6A7BBN3_9PLEO|nr:actin-domain-containing protein [Plenodomus tracheiphilus IPT5]
MPPKGSRKSTSIAPALNKTLVLDNGAYTLKLGLVINGSNPSYDDCVVAPNCIARSTRDKRTYIASELDSCKDFGELAFRRPVEKGFIVNWEAEKAIWEHEFMAAGAGNRLRVCMLKLIAVQCDPKETTLLLTEKPNCPKELQKNCDEIVFEQFEFASYYRCVGPALNAYNTTAVLDSTVLPQECILVIDTSYSDTTILPVYNGKLIQSALRRLTVGGKVLTNYLKELSSLRHYNMMEEAYLLNEIKEAVSYIVPSTREFTRDLEQAWKGRMGDRRELGPEVVVDYVLPDYENSIHGYARPHDPVRLRMQRGLQPVQGPREDVLPLGNERFAVPELLFTPTDIGIQEAGLPRAIMESLSVLPEALKVGLLANIVVVGGNSLINGFVERLEAELRALVPAEYILGITRAEDPIKHTWRGGARFASQPDLLREAIVTRADIADMSIENFPRACTASNPIAMRRIPRPLRALDASQPLALPRRSQPWCSGARLPTGAATLSTSPARGFLVPAGKQDKKKHQQFVRRWQKRLLGDSEPIGAHVDPYDPTSPVRIAPEEQGEYEEVLDDAVVARKQLAYQPEQRGYRPAASTHALPRVGDEAWLRQRLEGDMAREYEKLTLRTYTPLSLDMANDIEGLTGTPYTLRDENLLLAQTVHDATGRPYTHYNFGLHRKATTPRELRQRFGRAVVEVFVLKQAGLDMDLHKLPNGGVYEAPRWVQDIKLYRTDTGKLSLAFPQHNSAEELLKLMHIAPRLEESVQEIDDVLIDAAEADVEVPTPDLQEPTMPEEQLPLMDPATPAFKRAAVVKVDADKNFDFMSNRPVPRAKPIEQPEPITEVKAEEPVTAKAVVAEVASEGALPTAHVINPIPNVAQAEAGPDASTMEGLQWRGVRIDNIALKFAIYKRVHQLTSLRIPDPQLSSTETLGDLFGYLCAAAKPQPTTLHSAIFIEGQKARERSKHQQSRHDSPARQKANLGDLINLGNVEIRRTRPNKTEKNIKTGLDKVVQYALWERGLHVPGHTSSSRKGEKKVHRSKSAVGGPDLGRLISKEGAEYLAKSSEVTSDRFKLQGT